MAASAHDIRRWLTRLYGHEEYTHMLVVTDTFDYEDYPVYVGKSEDVRDIASKIGGREMQRVTEVYSRNHGLEEQMGQTRAFNYD